MVGKWTNEPCSEVDEVVNTFWVLTSGPVLFLGSYKSYSLGLTLYLVEFYIKEFLLGFLPHEGFQG